MLSNIYKTAFVISPPDDLLQTHPSLKHISHALAMKYVFKELVTEEHLKATGLKLWQTLDVSDDFDKSLQAAGRQILPIIIKSNQASIQQLP